VFREKANEVGMRNGEGLEVGDAREKNVKSGGCCRRLTGIVFARGLSLRARAPSSCFVRGYLKEVNKGASSRPFALRRLSQLARNIKTGDTPLRGGRKNCTE